jgi:2-polyprenyl-6-hydroxyphenyl methylase/3-demethylubiquinone-9 3-methyltransferase
MLKSLFRAKSFPPRTLACKCCGSKADWFGAVDFSKSCEDHRGKVMPDSGRAVDYFRCTSCGFLFTRLIDGWSAGRVAAEIYNADYVRVDPDFTGTRPRGNADLLSWTFEDERARLAMLDYGGGEGLMASVLRERGFDASSFDPFHDDDPRPPRRFDLVTAFEVVEHSPDPHATFADIRALTADNGAFLFTTLLQPADIGSAGLGWWYAAPRNGHVSLHTRESLRLAAERAGWTLESFDDNLHAAWVRRPDWMRHVDRSLHALRTDEERPSGQRLAALETVAPGQPDGEAATRACRHGTLRFLAHDRGAGRSLGAYGEHAEGELTLLGQLVGPGDTVLEAGAHVGAHTVFLARMVGPQGSVIAYEPQRPLYDLLRENLAANGLPQVRPVLEALGATRGSIHVPPVDYGTAGDFGTLRLGGTAGDTVGMETVDRLALPALRLIRVATRGMEAEVLRGARETLWRLRPLLYVGNEDPALSPQLVALVQAHGYRLWWHTPARFNQANFAGERANLFGTERSVNLLCVPEESGIAVSGLVEVRSTGDAPPT